MSKYRIASAADVPVTGGKLNITPEVVEILQRLREGRGSLFEFPAERRDLWMRRRILVRTLHAWGLVERGEVGPVLTAGGHALLYQIERTNIAKRKGVN